MIPLESLNGSASMHLALTLNHPPPSVLRRSKEDRPSGENQRHWSEKDLSGTHDDQSASRKLFVVDLVAVMAYFELSKP